MPSIVSNAASAQFHSAVKLQRWWRGKKRHQRIAALLQRRQRIAADLHKKQQELTYLRTLPPRKILLHAELSQREAAVRLQASWRGALQRKRFARLVQARRMQDAAKTLGRSARRFLDRRGVQQGARPKEVAGAGVGITPYEYVRLNDRLRVPKAPEISRHIADHLSHVLDTCRDSPCDASSSHGMLDQAALKQQGTAAYVDFLLRQARTQRANREGLLRLGESYQLLAVLERLAKEAGVGGGSDSDSEGGAEQRWAVRKTRGAEEALEQLRRLIPPEDADAAKKKHRWLCRAHHAGSLLGYPVVAADGQDDSYRLQALLERRQRLKHIVKSGASMWCADSDDLLLDQVEASLALDSDGVG
ncbi:unnamed protein product [Vitrella brassicaformis CCMP3155]|uniref:Uncharacterized protein n=1 Tax=Vitrella brassicaformis (strain CCMP3155) TaxID=1169540 RepID=A0A0G4E912_VITBC|nr:unnamed protein product [Vitrella brassicaformis CCMP3155]|mmetsp:Transcript_44597/g.126064  ORF Transcript_44597/g.126064 Transcript_44597/m.126064 type:complete len:361 (-) Transcript_44597:73-1155(-)|eukprot:CEL91691.1 unnamed protein product [Vitrella brassicaformis CCMP3155]